MIARDVFLDTFLSFHWFSNMFASKYFAVETFSRRNMLLTNNYNKILMLSKFLNLKHVGSAIFILETYFFFIWKIHIYLCNRNIFLYSNMLLTSQQNYKLHVANKPTKSQALRLQDFQFKRHILILYLI